MSAEASKLTTKVRIRKFSAEQTTKAAVRHNISPSDLIAEHFDEEPEEELHIDHEAQTVKLVRNNGQDRTAQTYTFEEWHARGN